MMTCDECENNLLQEVMSEDMRAHLEHCESCRDFQKVLNGASEASGDIIEPSSHVDMLILGQAQRIMRQKRRWMTMRRWAFGVAACFVCLCVFTWWSGNRQVRTITEIAQSDMDILDDLDDILFDCALIGNQLVITEQLFEEGVFSSDAIASLEHENIKTGESDDLFGWEDSMELETEMDTLELLVYGL